MDYTNIFESALPQPGLRATETAHRKIELQSPADLSFLVANVSRAARERINKQLSDDLAAAPPPDKRRKLTRPSSSGRDAALRVRVEELVDDYIRSTFNIAKDNLCINGMESEELETELARAQEGEEIEAFDSKLAHRIQSLATQIESHTLALANLRRSAPAATAAKFHLAFTRAAEHDDMRIKARGDADLQAARETKLDVGEIERLDEVRRTWQEGSENLDRLNAGIAPTVARLEKARAAVEVLER